MSDYRQQECCQMRICTGHSGKLLVSAALIALPVLAVLACPCPYTCNACVEDAPTAASASMCCVSVEDGPSRTAWSHSEAEDSCLHAIGDSAHVDGVMHTSLSETGRHAPHSVYPPGAYILAFCPAAADTLFTHDIPPPDNSSLHIIHCLFLC